MDEQRGACRREYPWSEPLWLGIGVFQHTAPGSQRTRTGARDKAELYRRHIASCQPAHVSGTVCHQFAST